MTQNWKEHDKLNNISLQLINLLDPYALVTHNKLFLWYHRRIYRGVIIVEAQIVDSLVWENRAEHTT